MQNQIFCAFYLLFEKTCRRAGVFPALGSVFYPNEKMKTLPSCGKTPQRWQVLP